MGHEGVAKELPTAALPQIPSLRRNRMRGLFRQDRPDDTALQDLAKHFETYLNTLLTSPHVRNCEALLEFLEIPPLPGVETSLSASFISATEVGNEAAQVVVEGSNALATVCRSFCEGLRRSFQAGTVINLS